MALPFLAGKDSLQRDPSNHLFLSFPRRCKMPTPHLLPQKHRGSSSYVLSPYAAEPMGWAVDRGLITGVSAGTLAPGGSATRAQVATILMRFCEMAQN